ncbi:glutamate receptor 3-like [Ptychodera flava]|uniref:glutamate receptor 3-like n=1 Tax=Ptychodera flava TaxID=63121 RepID=UPI00396A61B2
MCQLVRKDAVALFIFAVLCTGIHATNESTVEAIPRRLTVTTILAEPFLMMAEGNVAGNGAFKGYIPDLLQEVSRVVPFEYTLKLVDDSRYGSLGYDGEWNGMIGELLSQKADMAAAPLTISYMRERVVDFSMPFMTSGLTAVYKKGTTFAGNQNINLFAFLTPYQAPVWICIIVAGAVVGLTTYLLSRFSPCEGRAPSNSAESRGEQDQHVGIDDAFWFTFSTLMLQGYSKSPRSVAVRFLGIFWFFFVIVILFTYLSTVAAFLTVERVEGPVESFEGLSRQSYVQYGTIKGGSSEAFFKHSQVETYKKMSWAMNGAQPSAFVNSTASGIQRVRESKERYAFIGEKHSLQYIAAQQPCDLSVMPTEISVKSYGFAFRHNSTLREQVTRALLYLGESGQLDYLETKWWQGPCSEAATETDSPGGAHSISLSDIAGLFIILLIGIILSVLVLLLEVVVMKPAGKRAAKNGDKSDTTGL